jgi:hypothetical protein
MKDPDPLNLRPDDVMVKWRRDAIRDEEARHAAKREQQQREEQNAVAQLRAELHREIGTLRDEVYRLHDTALEATGTTIGEFSNKVADFAEKFTRDVQNELFTEIARRFGELTARVEALTGGVSSRAKDFRFVNEDDKVDVVELPKVRKVN